MTDQPKKTGRPAKAPKDTTARERKARERETKRKQGLKRLEVWAKPEHHQKFKELEAALLPSKN